MARYTNTDSANKVKQSKQGSVNPRTDYLSGLVLQLIRRRQELGLTQEAVDVRMGNTDRCVSKWECGLRTPTSFNLYCWAEALECSLRIYPL